MLCACSPNARLGTFIDGATGKLTNFPISTGPLNLISWRCVDVDLAAPHCDSIFLWFQIPNHLHRFFDIEAEVDREPEDDDNKEELYGEL